MGGKGEFYLIEYFLMINFCCLELTISPPPFDYDPFNSLREKDFSDEEFQRCFRHFDSQKFVHRFLNLNSKNI
jgi:hypothetical protein